jgi:hypothetical protein
MLVTPSTIAVKYARRRRGELLVFQRQFGPAFGSPSGRVKKRH